MKRLYIAASLLLACVMVFTSCGMFDLTLGTNTNVGGQTEPAITGENVLKVSFIDVGQGDSSLVEFPNGECMLIDAAEKEESESVIRYLKSCGKSKIDYLVMTHPHSDHMGGMAEVMEEFEIGVLYMTNAVNTTSAFEEVLDVAERKDITVKRSMKGVNITSGTDFTADFISPVSEEYENLNNYSSVIKIKYKEITFMFMGDAEKLAEDELEGDLSCQVVKVGHHGSTTSSSADFVEKTNAKWAVISVGEANKYGHPSSKIVERWQKIGAEILRTDVLGNIVFTTDGKSVNIKSGKGDVFDGQITDVPTLTPEVTPSSTSTPDSTEDVVYNWVLNTSSKKIHYPDCSGAKKISDANKAESSKTISELIKEGYSTCGICKPEE